MADEPNSMTLYTLVEKSRVDKCMRDNTLYKPFSDGHIGLREQLWDAVGREVAVGHQVSESSHVALGVTFQPLGIAHYTVSCGGAEHHFRSVLHKISTNADWDRGAWRFITDLPLYLKTNSGQELVRSEWIYNWHSLITAIDGVGMMVSGSVANNESMS